MAYCWEFLGIKSTEPIVNSMLAKICKTEENEISFMFSIMASKTNMREPRKNSQPTSDSRSIFIGE